MSPKSKDDGSNEVAKYQAELDAVEAELRETLKKQQPGFSQTMLAQFEAARIAGLNLAGAKLDWAKREAAIEEFKQLAEAYAAARRQEDAVALVVNRALMVALECYLREDELSQKANSLQNQINSHINQVERENHDLYQELNWQLSAIDDTLAGEVKAPTARQELFGFPRLPGPLTGALLKLADAWGRAQRA